MLGQSGQYLSFCLCRVDVFLGPDGIALEPGAFIVVRRCRPVRRLSRIIGIGRAVFFKEIDRALIGQARQGLGRPVLIEGHQDLEGHDEVSDGCRRDEEKGQGQISFLPPGQPGQDGHDDQEDSQQEQARDRKGSFSRKGRQRSEEQAVKGSRDEGCHPGIAGVFVEPVLHRAGAEI